MAFVILDRDGVINYDSEAYIKSPAEWRPIPGSLAAIAQLNRSGHQVFVATNQSGIARGYYDLTMLELIHQKFKDELSKFGGHIKEIFYCPHHPDDNCDCRKPRPGLLHQIQQKYKIDLSKAYFIGDSVVDIEAAKAAGCTPLLVLTGNGEYSQKKYPNSIEVARFKNLAEAVSYVIHKKKKYNG